VSVGKSAFFNNATGPVAGDMPLTFVTRRRYADQTEVEGSP
jgi:hypothetical protein